MLYPNARCGGPGTAGAPRARRFARHTISVIVLAALMLSGLALTSAGTAAAGPGASAAECLARSGVTKLGGTYSSQYKVASPGADRTFDARTATFTAYPFSSKYPFTLGSNNPGVRMCVVGGTVIGQQSRSLTWDQMKNQHDGDGLRMAGNDWYVADGLRVDNVEDGFAPRGTAGKYPMDGDGFVLRNAYMKYIRDDCVENDDIAGGLIEDSLFDGCNTGISERPTQGTPAWNHPAPPGETLTVDRVLLRLQAMPGPRGTNDPSVLGHGQLFKWSSVANKLVVRDSIFLVEKKPNGGDASFPSGTVAKNVTVVWLGGGSYPGKIPSGVKITTDRSVWDKARDHWLARHGCTSFTSCSKLHNPDPYGEPSPAPTTTSSPASSADPISSPAPVASPAVQKSFVATADATIRKGYPKKNYGKSVALALDSSPEGDSLLKFTVGDLGGKKVSAAWIVLWCTDGGPDGGGTFSMTGSSWSESTVTWANAPSMGAMVGTLGPVVAGKAYLVDVTSVVAGAGTYSFRASLESPKGARYASKESTTASQRPVLVVELV